MKDLENENRYKLYILFKGSPLQCEAIRSEQFENGPFHKPTTYEQHV